MNANPTWVFEIEQGSGTEIEVKFVNGATRIDFNAELEDGAVRVRVGVRGRRLIHDRHDRRRQLRPGERE